MTLPGHVTAKLKDVTGEYGSKVEALRKEVDKLAKLTGATAADWKKSKTIPSASAKHAQAVADAASTFHLALKGNGVYFSQVASEFDAERERLQRNVDIARNGIRGKIATLKKEAGDVIANPTPEQFKGTASAGFYQRIRGIGADLAALSEDPRIDQFRLEWLGFAKAGYLPKNDEEVKPKVKEVLSKVAELDKLLG